jgi:hypothetical protein
MGLSGEGAILGFECRHGIVDCCLRCKETGCAVNDQRDTGIAQRSLCVQAGDLPPAIWLKQKGRSIRFDNSRTVSRLFRPSTSTASAPASANADDPALDIVEIRRIGACDYQHVAANSPVLP